MEVTRLYTDNEGNSHFEEWPINMTKETAFGFISDEYNQFQVVLFSEYFTTSRMAIAPGSFQDAYCHLEW